MTNLVQLVEVLKRGAEMTGKSLGPGEDWFPLGAFETSDNKAGLIEIPPFETQREKEMSIAAVAAMLKEMDAVAAACLFSVWGKAFDKDDEDGKDVLAGRVRVSELPDREEMLIIYGIGKDVELIYVKATITRSEDGTPTLGEWEDPITFDALQGVMIDPIVQAIHGEEVLH